MSKHTPGPWTTARMSCRNLRVATFEGGDAIAEVYHPDAYSGSAKALFPAAEAAEANARLIAAAPELLAAARLASDALADDGCDHHCLCKCSRCSAIDALEAAIAKALPIDRLAADATTGPVASQEAK